VLVDIDQWWGNDLSPSNTGDLATVSGTTRGEQRILRRLLTNPGDYIWEPTYGAGLGQFIGRTADTSKIVAVIRAALTLESVVAKTPAPQISVTPLASDPTGFTVTINYVDAPSNQPVILSFSVSPPSAAS
jgi:hypothetical protein